MTSDFEVDCKQPPLWPDDRRHCPDRLDVRHVRLRVRARSTKVTYLGRDSLHLAEFVRERIDASLLDHLSQSR